MTVESPVQKYTRLAQRFTAASHAVRQCHRPHLGLTPDHAKPHCPAELLPLSAFCVDLEHRESMFLPSKGHADLPDYLREFVFSLVQFF